MASHHSPRARVIILALKEPARVRAWIAQGCRPVASLHEAEAALLAASRPRPRS